MNIYWSFYLSINRYFIRKTYFDNSSFPRKLYKHIKTTNQGDNIYKKYCYINGCWNCKGKITVPYGSTIWKYTCNKLNPVTRCEVDHYDSKGNPVCFKYEFITYNLHNLFYFYITLY